VFRMSPDIAVETVSSRVVAGIDFSTTMATLPQDMSASIEQLFEAVSTSPMTAAGPVIAVYTDEMRLDRPWNCEVCMPVENVVAEHPPLRTHELPGGLVATITHAGAYDGLKATYNSVFEWFTQHGHTYAGPPREIYLNGPHEVPEEQLRTRLEFPVILSDR